MDTIQPSSADEAAQALAACAQMGRRVTIRGGGTKAGWTTPSAAADVTLSTLGLHRVVAHRHGDLTATVEAGARLDDVNRELARHGQWIPLDPAWSNQATIGGIVATNDAGPRRHRYGAPRDLIIGVEIARADGIRAKAGGIVVKNVAGYDLARLMTGSFGSLALITSATFKLYPIPQTSRTVVADLPSNDAARALVLALNAGQLTPTAVEIQAPPLRLLIRFESTEASVTGQSEAAAKVAASAGATATRIVAGEDERREWQEHAARIWNGSGAVLRMTLLPGDLADALDAVQRAAGGAAWEVAGRAGLGVVLARVEGDAALQARAVEALRSRVSLDSGSVVLLRGSDQLTKSIEGRGPQGDAGRVMESIRRAFDPAGVLR